MHLVQPHYAIHNPRGYAQCGVRCRGTTANDGSGGLTREIVLSMIAHLRRRTAVATIPT